MSQKYLFDKIYEPTMSLKKLKKAESLFGKHIFGTLEVIAKNVITNKITHHQKSSYNQSLVWAKHCMMKLISGQIMEKTGQNRNLMRLPAGTSNIVDGKGTFVSNESFFKENPDSVRDGYGLNNYLTSIDFTNLEDTNSYKFPYYPTKMLFGTGNGSYNGEYAGLNDVDDLPKPPITDEGETLNIGTEGWIQSVHPIGDILNPDEYGIANNSPSVKRWESYTIDKYSNNIQNWLPSFVYMKRNLPYNKGNEISIEKNDINYPEYNKISFNITMPAQLLGEYYPYNYTDDPDGFLIKYAGLFCDAGWVNYLGGNSIIDVSNSPGLEFKYGICWAKKAIQPIRKTPDISLNFNWTLYIPRI